MGKTAYTKITPLPSNIPRQLALELLHSHEEVIQLNPLVTGVRSIEAPRTASTDEYYSNWYEISQIITWGLGIKSKYSFKGVFHDQPWGLQTHVYAPLGVDMRNKYRIGGNQPDEPREARELGVDTPLDGLYLREDVEITCNVAMMGIVKKEAKEATGIMISRLTRKAELLDEGKLLAMFERGKLKTSKPRGGNGPSLDEFGVSPPHSPTFMYGPDAPASPALSQASSVERKGYGNYHDIARSSSYRGSVGSFNSSVAGHQSTGASNLKPIHEMPATAGHGFVAELPGDQAFQPGQASSPLHQPASPYTAYTPPTQARSLQRNSNGSFASPGSVHSQPQTWTEARASPANEASQQTQPIPNTLQPAFRFVNSDAPSEDVTPSEPADSNVEPSPARQDSETLPVHTSHHGSEQAADNEPSSDLLQPARSDWPLPLRTRTPSPAPPATPTPANALPAVIPSPPSVIPPPPPGPPPSSTATAGGTSTALPPPPSTPPPLPQRNDKRLSFLPADVSPITATPADRTSIVSAASSGSAAAAAPMAKCPVCNVFEGDEAAVTHHVERSHFD